MDETSTADRLKPPFPSGTARPGFLLIIVMVIGAVLGLLLLNAYQQNIRTRFQSQAFLQNQLFFLELNRTVQHVIHHFRQKSLDQIQETRFPRKPLTCPGISTTGALKTALKESTFITLCVLRNDQIVLLSICC